MSDREHRDASMEGKVERVTDDGVVFVRLPNGLVDARQVPLEQVPRFRKLTLQGD